MLKRVLIGSPLKSSQQSEEKLTKKKALAIFSSDALSSVAYATEEILLVLALIGVSAFHYSLPIAGAIILLLTVVTLSYRQVIKHFPSGGGAYIVAREHLGRYPSLSAGAALMIDYVLTVAVSISSGVAALTSAFPSLLTWKVELCVILIVILTILNLRGVRESASLFAIPTYLFVVTMLIMIVAGVWKLATEGVQGFTETASSSPSQFSTMAIIFLVLRAFSSGCSAMTGVEAISNGVPAFKEPSKKNAIITMIAMSSLLGIMFAGITGLAYGFGIQPSGHETVVSQIAAHVFGNGVFYYFIQIVTMLILFLAANTSFAGFPQLASIIAADSYLPRSLATRGDRLVFSNGIIFLSVFAIVLVIIFQGQTHSLIPLYAVGVFLSFTIAQAGMIKAFLSKKISSASPASHIFIIGFGMTVTGIVTVITAVAKFTEGAWIIFVVIPSLIWLFHRIHRHYEQVAEELRVYPEVLATTIASPLPSKVVIPISGVTTVVLNSIAYAKTISNDIEAVAVCFNKEQEIKLKQKWAELHLDIPLKTVHSPYRSLLKPLLYHLHKTEKLSSGQFITVLIPQFFVAKWYHNLLHNQTAIFLRAALLLKKDIVVATIPFHFRK